MLFRLMLTYGMMLRTHGPTAHDARNATGDKPVALAIEEADLPDASMSLLFGLERVRPFRSPGALEMYNSQR